MEKVKAKEEEERRIREELNDNLKKARMAVTKFESDFDRELTDVFAVKSQLDKLITNLLYQTLDEYLFWWKCAR